MDKNDVILEDFDLEELQRIFFKPTKNKERAVAEPWCNCEAKKEFNYKVFKVSLNSNKRCALCDHEVIWSVGKPKGF
jgi:hypothetical protein